MPPMFDFCRECFVVAICKFFVRDMSDWQFANLNQMAVLDELSGQSTLIFFFFFFHIWVDINDLNFLFILLFCVCVCVFLSANFSAMKINNGSLSFEGKIFIPLAFMPTGI